MNETIKTDTPCNIAQRLLDAKKLVNKLISLTACPTNGNVSLSLDTAKMLELEVDAIKIIFAGKNEAVTNA